MSRISSDRFWRVEAADFLATTRLDRQRKSESSARALEHNSCRLTRRSRKRRNRRKLAVSASAITRLFRSSVSCRFARVRLRREQRRRRVSSINRVFALVAARRSSYSKRRRRANSAATIKISTQNGGRIVTPSAWKLTLVDRRWRRCGTRRRVSLY